MIERARRASPRVFIRQVFVLAVASLKARYRKTITGFFWVILNPLIMYGAQSFVFHSVLRIQYENYPLFLLSGLLPWIFITQSLDMCTPLLLNSGRLLKAYPVHPVACLLSQLVDNSINFVCGFAAVVGCLSLSTPGHFLRLLWLPVPLLFLFGGIFGLCWFFATLQIFFRDTRFVLSFVLNVSFFLTPVFYPMSFVPEPYRWLINLNPIHHLISPFRVIAQAALPEDFLRRCAFSALVAGGSIVLAAAYWRTKRNAVYATL